MGEPSTLDTNSFYYFFSATPQVLAGVMALFGLFFIFRIQSIKDILLGLVMEIVDFLEVDAEYTKDAKLKEERERTIIIIKKFMRDKNLNNIKYLLNEVIVNDSKGHIVIDEYIQRFNEELKLVKNLRIWTINLSSFTALIIIACLGMIPFSTQILSNPNLLNWLFGITIISSGISFIGLIIILNVSINNKTTIL